jgi:DNA-binding CsgD family transcriptional regulator
MEFEEALKEVHFTRREQDVISCLLHGRGLKKTAQLLGISSSTVETHTRNIMVKLGCHSRERVIDILEQSGRGASFKKRYTQLVNVPGTSKKIKRSFLSLQKLKEKNLIDQKIPEQESSQDIQEEIVQETLKSPPFYKIFLKRLTPYKTALLGGSVCLSLVGLCFFMIIQSIDTLHKDLFNSYKKLPAIRCEIPLPQQTTLLNRSSLIKKIEDKFKKPEDIQAVILMGMGGVGKTTLARQYIRDQEASVVWEINAETEETLILSFEKLAEALTQTEVDRRKFIKIESKPSPKREEKLLKYVKEKLSSRPYWVLFYDNVEKFSDIDPYFPHDSKV